MIAVYLPLLTEARLVRQYVFQHPEHGPSCCALVTDCQAHTTIQYAHVLYVYAGGDFLTGRPCFAVAAEVNRRATPGDGCSHFLGVFPGQPLHVNLGASDDCADLEHFASRALDVVVGHFGLAQPPREISIPTVMAQRFRVPAPMPPEERAADSAVKPRKWWQFWR